MEEGTPLISFYYPTNRNDHKSLQEPKLAKCIPKKYGLFAIATFC